MMHPVLPSEETARQIAGRYWRKAVRSVSRFPAGLCHYVYEVTSISGERVAVRIARPGNEPMIRGAVYWHERLRPLGIPLASLLFAELEPEEQAYAFLVLERLEGADLGEVYPLLSSEAKRALGVRVATLQQTVAGLPAARGYGSALSYEQPKFDSCWNDTVSRNLDVCRMRAGGCSLISLQDITALERAASAIRPALAHVPPTAFLDDITTKNLIVAERGQLSGIVDIDTLCFGDPLFTLGLTQAACARLGYDSNYTDAWKQVLDLKEDERARLAFYTRLFATVLLSEHGQRFNRDTCVNFEPDAIQRLRLLLTSEPSPHRQSG